MPKFQWICCTHCVFAPPNLAAGGFKKSNSLKSRPAPCQGSIPIGNGTLAQAQLPSHLRRRTPQVLLGRLPGHPVQWILGCAHLDPTAPLKIPWLTVYRAPYAPCVGFLRFCSLSAWLACGWVGWVVGWLVSQGSELSFLVENPRRLRTNIEASGGPLRDLCPNSRRFVALGVCLRPPTLPPDALKNPIP